jgi:hypothetical protein
MPDEADSPELTIYLVDRMNRECELNLIKPKFVEAGRAAPKKQKGLFD